MAWLQETALQREGDGRRARSPLALRASLSTRRSWTQAGEHLASGQAPCSALWGDTDTVHLAVLEDGRRSAVVTLPCPTRRFPSIGAHASARPAARAHHPRSLRLASPRPRPMRAAGSTTAAGACGSRSASASAAPATGDPYAFHPAEGPPMHQIPVGPVHAGIIEPGHFRFTANGETVVRLEERLGYVHKGIDGLMAGATLEQAAKLAGRVSGDSTVAYAHRLCARRRGGARAGAAAARRLAARADGRAGADRQPFRRHRRHLQRRLVLADPCPLRHPARARAARGRHLLRPSADDGPRRARRRGRRSRQGRHRQPARAHRARSAGAFPSWSSSTTAPPRCSSAR